MKSLIFIIGILCVNLAFAQKEYNLKLRTTYWGYGFKQGKVKLSLDDMQSILIKTKDGESLVLLRKARKQMNVYHIFGNIGAVIFGYQLGNMFFQKKSPNYLYFGLGSAGIFTGLLAKSYARDNLEKVAQRYNKDKLDLGFGATESGGIGLIVKL